MILLSVLRALRSAPANPHASKPLIAPPVLIYGGAVHKRGKLNG